MRFLEKDLEQIIWDASKQELRSRGLFLRGKGIRQLRIGNYGIADIVCFDRTENTYGEPVLVVDVLELKQEKITVSAFLQSVRYLKGISRYIQDYRRKDIKILPSITLIGKTIDMDSDMNYIPDLCTDEGLRCRMITYDYKIDGIYFSPMGSYHLINEGFR